MKSFLSILLILIMTVALGACSGNHKGSDDESVIDVYYIDTKTSTIASEKYELIGTKKEEQVYELLHMLKKAPDNLLYKSVMPDEVTYSYDLNEDNSLTINFDSVYSELSGIEEVLCRAAIVKTLSQIKGVEYIQFTVSGSTLIDSNGDGVGPMTAEDFIDNTETNANYMIKLYFANEDGDALVEYDTELNYTGNSSLEELAIEQLINGPTQLGMYDTIPKGTVLLNISKNDGICTVDFNEKFLDKIPDIDEEVTIYSVVNTLVELPDINKVQFTINSEVVETFWEDLEFNDLFERNLDMIQETK